MKIAHADLNWIRWFLGAILPGALSIVVAPLLLYRIYHPVLTDTQAATDHAHEELERKGSLSTRERKLGVIMLLVMLGWITSP